MCFRKLSLGVLVLLSFTCGAVIGCGAKRALDPIQPSGFIDWRGENAITDRTPFSYYWADPNHPLLKWIRSGARYQLYVPAIRRDYLTSDTDSGETLESRGELVAEYFHRKLIKAIKEENEKSGTVTVLDEPNQTSLTLEIALTKLDTGNPLAYAAGFAAPVPGVATTIDTLGTASLTMEVKLYDSATKSLLAEFADRRIPRVRPIIDINKFTKTRPLYDIANDWSTEIARATVTNLEKDELEGTSNFSLLPW